MFGVGFLGGSVVCVCLLSKFVQLIRDVFMNMKIDDFHFYGPVHNHIHI